MDERGGLNVGTLEEASLIAGYEVAVPAYIPEGFRRSKNIMLSRRGVGLPENIAANFPIEVQQVWFWAEDDSIWFMILQSPKKFEVGRSGDKYSHSWNDGDMYYGLSGVLSAPLTEEVLDKVASSVGVD